MRQTIIRARVRPARIAVLINRQGTQAEFVMAVRFLSRLWGGMYAPIFPTNPSPPDPLTEFRLSTARPDYVYSIGLDGNDWMPRIQDACQPRGYRILDEDLLKQLYRDHNEEHLTDRHLLNYLFRQQNHGFRKRVTRLIFWDEQSASFPLAAALFGIPDKVRPSPYAPVEYDGDWGDQGNPTSLIKAHTAIVQKYEQCWMELTSQELSVRFHVGGTGHPTIVLIENMVEDLSLFWNLRMEGHEWIPRWIIPLPMSIAGDQEIGTLLKTWISEFFQYHQRPNHIFITSQKANPEGQQEFADWVKSTLEGSPIEFVDVWPPANRIPVVTAFESEKLIDVRCRGRRATWLRPQSRVAELFGSGVSWMVDLVDEPSKNRAPFELFLPAGKTTVEILNSPNPPLVQHARVDQYGLGVDSINVRCTNGEELITHWLPTSEEVLEEFLHPHGLRFKKDEKRSCYLPALRLLGGLEQASSTLAGTRGAILQELSNGPANIDELKLDFNSTNTNPCRDMTYVVFPDRRKSLATKNLRPWCHGLGVTPCWAIVCLDPGPDS